MLPRRVSLLLKRCYSGNHVVPSPFGQVDVPRVTLDQYLWDGVGKWEDKTAVECGLSGKRMSYKELRTRSYDLAGNLTSLGMDSGTALLVLPNCTEFPLALLGAIQAGMTVSAANPVYTSGELKHQATDSGARCVITSPECLDQVISADLDVPIICTGENQREGVHSFNQMTEGSSVQKRLPGPEERLGRLAFLPYSSGTTGLPKGVRLSHRNVVANLEQISHPSISPLEETTADHQDTLPAVLPFFHIYGSVVVMLRGLSKGVKLVTLPKFEPTAFLQLLRRNKDIVLHAVPPIVNFLGSRPEVKAEDLRGLRYTVTGAAPCSAADLDRLKEKKQHAICQAYGMTESSPVLTYPKTSCSDKATIGPPVASTVGRIVDPNDGKPVPVGLHGELCFRGPQVMEGYHNKPEATAQTVDGEGWLHTGDIGYTDEEGNFFIVDRLKELIKVKGFQVAPAELEAILRQHPDVLDAGVTSTTSDKSGELPVAFLVPRPGRTLDPVKVSDWVAKRVAPYKRLAKILLVAEVPKSPAGKILRRQLKDIARDEIKLD